MTTSLDLRLFNNLEPIRGLGEQSLREIARTARLLRLNPGENLPFVSSRQALYYLVKGQIELRNDHARLLRVDAGTARAAMPLYDEDMVYQVACSTNGACIVEIDRILVERLLENGPVVTMPGTIEVSDEVQLDARQNDLLHKLYAAYEQETLELPSMPEVALRLREAARDQDVAIGKLTRIVQSDAAIAGSLLHAANGPLFCAAGPVKNVRDAIVRLGLATTQSLAMAVGLLKVFHAHSPGLRRRINQTWRDSLTVSGLAYAVARRVRGLNQDRALLAGLLHRVGVIPILGYLDAHGLEGSDRDIDGVVQVLSKPVGIMVMNYWEMNDDLLQVIEEYDQWDRTPAQADYCDAVQVSWLYYATRTGRDHALPAIDEVAAVARLGLQTPAEEAFAEYSAEAQTMTDMTPVI